MFVQAQGRKTLIYNICHFAFGLVCTLRIMSTALPSFIFILLFVEMVQSMKRHFGSLEKIGPLDSHPIILGF